MTIKKESRKYKRVKENVDVKIDIPDGYNSTTEFEIATSENISASGVLLKYDKPLKIGQTINVSFMNPNSFDLISTKAVIVRVEFIHDDLWEFGIAFFDMSKEDEKKLDFYLTYH